MVLMAALGLMFAAGGLLILRWRSVGYRPWPSPPAAGDPAPAGPPVAALLPTIALRYARGLAIGLGAGFWAGLLMTGPAVRLIMRLLAATAGAEAQGALTEAEEVVGDISLGGTIGLVMFGGVLPGQLSAAVYLLVRRWLPAGWRGGLLFGALHLVVVATRADPLRPGNEDFDLVGPGWLSVATFGLATLLHGMAVVAFVNRYSRVLPPATKSARAWTGSLLPAVPVLIVPFVLVPAAIGLGLALILGRLDARGRVAASRRFLVGGRLALAAVAIVLMPGTLVDLYDLVVRPA